MRGVENAGGGISASWLRRIQDFDLSPNSPLNDPFSKFTSDDPREFPASAFLANSPAGEFAVCLRHVSVAEVFFFAQLTFNDIQILFGLSLDQMAVSVLRQVFERAARTR